MDEFLKRLDEYGRSIAFGSRVEQNEARARVVGLYEAARRDPMKCPECGRRKATSVQDVQAGCCPKWWAIRDPAADRDCAHVAALESRA